MLPVELFRSAPSLLGSGSRGEDVTPYDAWYVALAESLDADLATLDVRLSRAAGPRCTFRLPPGC